MAKEWPFPGDSPVARARKMALAFRAALEEVKPELVEDLDDRFLQWGERWHTSRPAPYEPDEWIPTKEAADLINLSVGALSSLRVSGRIKGRLRRPRGRGFEFKVADVLELSTKLRGRGHPWREETSTDKVPD